MNRRYAILSSRTNEHIAVLSYNEIDKTFSICVREDIEANKLPFFFRLYAENGIRQLNHKIAFSWVRPRICPPSRHNIRDILRVHGLKEYDEMSLLKLTKGICGLDDLYIEEMH